MRIQVEHHADLGAAPRSLYRGERRIDIIEIMDSGTDPAIATSKSEDVTVACISSSSTKIRDQWELIMFSAASAQRLATRAALPGLFSPVVNEQFSDLGAL